MLLSNPLFDEQYLLDEIKEASKAESKDKLSILSRLQHRLKNHFFKNSAVSTELKASNFKTFQRLQYLFSQIFSENLVDLNI